MATSFRPPKQWVLTEHESITSFANWQSNIIYHLSLNNEFSPFIEPNATWGKQSRPNRGLTNDPNTIDEAQRKTATQKNIILERMLGLISQFAPSLLRSDIIKRSISLPWIWKRIRKHYSFCQSEVNFLKIASIKQQEGERYETLFQRIIAHLEDNLLTIDSGLTHDGSPVTDNEEMSPTTERLAVYLWLNLIDERLPAYVSRVFAHDLQTKSLKDIQPQICAAMDSLLLELNAQEDIQVHYTRSSYPNKWQRQKPSNRRPPPRPNQSQKLCILCKAANRPYQGHDIASCWFITKFDRMEISKALSVDVEDAEPTFQSDVQALAHSDPNKLEDHQQHSEPIAAHRVQCNSSPFFYAFYKHMACKIVIDTGATSSLVSEDFVKRAGIKQHPTSHAARQIDKSPLKLLGEVKFVISFRDFNLPIEALVTGSLDCDILAGVPFCKSNNIDVHMGSEAISLNDFRIPYGSKPNFTPHEIYGVNTSTVVRPSRQAVIYPGDYLEINDSNISNYEGEVAIEPRTDSPLHGTWPQPSLSRVIGGTLRIPNETNEPVHVSKSQHLATIRRVTTPSMEHLKANQLRKPPEQSSTKIPFSSTINIDPDNTLTSEEKGRFLKLHETFDNVFNPQFGVYNDRSGRIRAKLNLGKVIPPSRKPKLPIYTHSQLQLLQEEADKLESLGVLAKPEDVGVDIQFASPSFLVKKPDGSFRFVTAFNELCQYTKILPVVAHGCDEILRRLSSWRFIIKTDLTKSFFQIPLEESSIPYLATATPFKGLRVYLRSAMGMPGSSEHLQELTSRVLGDLVQEGIVLVIADDLHVCGNTVEEIYNNWYRVLQRLQENNLTLSPNKTVICPKSTTILGWKWNSGNLSVLPHKVTPLISSAPPTTCTAMRSYIGAYKAIARCIPKYSSLLSPLEDIIKGLDSRNKIDWSSERLTHFHRSQDALKSPDTLTIPVPSDQLIMTVDASPLNNGICATLYVIRNGQRHLADNFSMKLREHQYKWQPCEHEALAITAGIKHFSPYIRESKHPLQALTDSKPCVQAFQKLCKGQFSASSRISTFLSCLSEHHVSLCHIKGIANTSSDYGSRNPQTCPDSSCQICKFVHETASSVVASVAVSDVLSGQTPMPFLNHVAWKTAQHDCKDLRRTYAHLSNGTRPSRKTKNLKDVRRYLQIASINNASLLVRRVHDPYVFQKDLIIIPKDILPGLVTALHLHFNHTTKHQLAQIFCRYFFGLGSDAVIQTVVKNCAHCNSLLHLPKEIMEQTSSPTPTSPGQQFAADVIRRTRQKILLVRDVFSSFTSASLIRDETADTLRNSVLSQTSFLRADQSTVRVDNAPGFQSLKRDKILLDHGIELDFGRIKNPNKNPVAEKAIREFEDELLRIDPSGAQVSESILAKAISQINSRIRNRGLSSKEILFRRDQATGEHLNFDDALLSKQQASIRIKNHGPSASSKATTPSSAIRAPISVGTLVFIKAEGSKLKGRERYIVMQISDRMAVLQKLNGSIFSSRRYEVPLTEIYPVVPMDNTPSNVPATTNNNSDTDSQTEFEDDANVTMIPDVTPVPTAANRPKRTRREPAWLRGEEWDKE